MLPQIIAKIKIHRQLVVYKVYSVAVLTRDGGGGDGGYGSINWVNIPSGRCLF